ncbi:MAG: MBL fold metallo-hydrolase [Candidatus Promineifilaceae bacterium]|nr:MBL fold metallo-hydrolase [Candidatus Promineifilaceae bacterium]
MEIFPNVHWLETGRANSYLITNGEALALIDTGSPGNTDVILDAVRQLGHAPTALKQILITHADWDHAGNVAALHHETGAAVLAGEQTAALLQEGTPPEHLPRPLHFLLRPLLRFDPVPAEAIQILQPGEHLPLLEGLEVMATPGHTPDHISFFSRVTGALFAGDSLNTTGSQLGLGPRILAADLEQARESARLLLALTPALFACGHGKPLQNHSLQELMMLLQRLK